MDKKIIKEIEKRVHLVAGHTYITFAYFYSGKQKEAGASARKVEKETDNLIESLKGLKS